MRSRMPSNEIAGIERVEWSEFQAQFFAQWQQGEHVAIIGPTGRGKTTLARAILPRRSHVAVFATKPADATLEKFRAEGYQKIRKWPPTDQQPRVLLWPPMRNLVDDVRTQQRVFSQAITQIFTAGKWTIFADELRYLTDTLRMRKHMELLWLQGRSNKITIVGATQRPAHVPLELYSQSTHLFFYGDRDDTNLKRIGGLGGLDSQVVRKSVAKLARHDVLYINATTEQMIVTRSERNPT